MPETVVAGLAVVALVVALLALLLALVAYARARRVGGRRGVATTGDAVVDRLLADERRRVEALSSQLDDLTADLRRVEEDGRRSLTRVGVVRYNPFEDTGGNQSFALAVLDGHSDGVVLSSLHSRQQTRIYLKTVRAGASEAALSTEEQEAVRRAASREVAART